MMGRPKNTALAPNANALNTSVPLRTPPSKNTSAAPFTALAISGKTSSCNSIFHILITVIYDIYHKQNTKMLFRKYKKAN